MRGFQAHNNNPIINDLKLLHKRLHIDTSLTEQSLHRISSDPTTFHFFLILLSELNRLIFFTFF